jgi:hypothetical protein
VKKIIPPEFVAFYLALPGLIIETMRHRPAKGDFGLRFDFAI